MKPVLFPTSGVGSGRHNTRILFEPWPARGQDASELILEGEFEQKMIRLLRGGLVRLPGRAPRILLLDGAFGFVPQSLRLDALVSPSNMGALHAITEISTTQLPPTPRIKRGLCKPQGVWTVADIAMEIGSMQRRQEEIGEPQAASTRPEISAS